MNVGLWILLILACSGGPEPVMRLVVDENTVSLDATVPVSAATLVGADGAPIITTRPGDPAKTLSLPVPPGISGALAVEATIPGGLLRGPIWVEPRGDRLRVEIQAPVGAESIVVKGGELLPMSVVTGAKVDVVVRARAASASVVEFGVNGTVVAAPRTAAGERVGQTLSIRDDAEISVRAGTESVHFRLDAQPISLDELASRLRVTAIHFPAGTDGRADPVRQPGRITIPSPWWQSVLSTLGLGTRVRDPNTPWAWAGLGIENTDSTPINLVIRGRVLDGEGLPDATFRPRMREGDDGTGNTSVMLRVPAGSTVTATLPVFVNEATLGDGPWTQEFQVLPIGLDQPIATASQPLYQSRGSSWVSGGLALALAGSAAGALLLLTRLQRWLRIFDTRTLVTIALFASLSFVVGTAAQLFGLGLASAAGPFATMIVGLVDDLFGVTLLATLLVFAPRPGVVALCAVVSWLLRGVALGSLSPLDFVFVACRVAFYEGSLYLCGLTRIRDWSQESRWRRQFRLAAGFGFASVFTAAASLIFHSVLYRLYYAEWYVVMILAGPGFLYPIFGAVVGESIATALRRVED